VREYWVKWQDHTSKGEHGFSIPSLLFLADHFRPLPEAYGLKENWYPTLSYGLEVKKTPPTPWGWKWLFLKVETYVVKNGRFDLNVKMFDEQHELVALGNHTAMIVDPLASAKFKVAQAKI
jgi:hypothetical protein